MNDLEMLRHEHRQLRDTPPDDPAMVREFANQLYEAGATTRAPLDREELRSMRRFWLDWLKEPANGDLIKPYAQAEEAAPPSAPDFLPGPPPAAQADSHPETLFQKLADEHVDLGDAQSPIADPFSSVIRRLDDAQRPADRTTALPIVLVALVSGAALILGLLGLLTGRALPPNQAAGGLPLTATAIVRQAYTPLILGPTSGEPLRPGVITFTGLGVPGSTVMLLEGMNSLGPAVVVDDNRGWRIDLDLRDREGVLTVTAAVITLDGDEWTPQAFSPPVTIGITALPDAEYSGKLDYLVDPEITLAFQAGTSTTAQPGVSSGGSVDIRAAIETICDGEARGFASEVPNVRVTLTGDPQASLRFFFLPDSLRGDSDTTLVVYTPDERWYCDDDTGGSQQPMITLEAPPAGDYLIWVGGFNKGSSISGSLYVTEDDIGPADVF